MEINYKDYRIETSEEGFILREKQIVQKGKTKGQEVWPPVGYYSRYKFENVLKTIAHLEMNKKRETLSIGEFISEYGKVLDKVTKEFTL